jgi:hypothetical protein
MREVTQQAGVDARGNLWSLSAEVAGLPHGVSATVRPNGQKYYGVVWKPVAEAVLTFRNPATLSANDEDDPEIPVDARTATASKVQGSAPSTQELDVEIGVRQKPFDAPLDSRSRRRIAAQVLHESLFVGGAMITHPKPRCGSGG